jgi:hypothetical protein
LSGRAPPSGKYECLWADSHVITRQRLHIRLRIELLLPVFLCGRCRRQVVICRRCDRGQVYCGPDCALEVRRRNQREARRRYQATDRGRRMHTDRSREYRARGRSVTDQGPTPSGQPGTGRAAAKAAQPPVRIAAGRMTVCCRCGNPVSAWARRSPIRRPRRRLRRL